MNFPSVDDLNNLVIWFPCLHARGWISAFPAVSAQDFAVNCHNRANLILFFFAACSNVIMCMKKSLIVFQTALFGVPYVNSNEQDWLWRREKTWEKLWLTILLGLVHMTMPMYFRRSHFGKLKTDWDTEKIWVIWTVLKHAVWDVLSCEICL